MSKKPLYRVLQRETLNGWSVVNRDDDVVATCSTRTEARAKARQLILEHTAFGNETEPAV